LALRRHREGHMKVPPASPLPSAVTMLQAMVREGAAFEPAQIEAKAGRRRSPQPGPGPAGGPILYGHVWVVLAILAGHPGWGVAALPLLTRLYVRAKDLAGIDPWHRPAFRTNLELAVELLRWAVSNLRH
jgi:hypothetical protein